MAQVTSYTLSSDPGPKYDRIFSEAHKKLIEAADEWSQGHPEEPPTEQILKEILNLFQKEGFLKRPY